MKVIRRVFFTIMLLGACSLASGSDNNSLLSIRELRGFNYNKVDSFVLNMPDRHFETVEELTSVITKDFTSDHEKFRSIFRWVSDKVSYDCDAYHYTERYNRHIRFYSFLKRCVSDSFVENMYKRNVKIEPNDVLKRRTAICSGYAALLKEMCDAAGIPCEKVRGYVKSSPDEISTRMNVTCHAWNVVKLYGKWYPVDITWASGYTEGNCSEYVKDYSDSYFLQDPDQFIKNHFPRQKEWQLTNEPITLRQFCEMPNVLEGYFKHDLDLHSLQSGILNVALDKKVALKFKSKKELTAKDVGLYIGKSCNDTFTLQKDEQDNYVVEFTARNKGESVATILINSVAALQYKVITH